MGSARTGVALHANAVNINKPTNVRTECTLQIA